MRCYARIFNMKLIMFLSAVAHHDNERKPNRTDSTFPTVHTYTTYVQNAHKPFKIIFIIFAYC